MAMKGAREALRLTSRAFKDIENTSAANLVRAGAFIKNESVANAPHRTGHLRASHFTTPIFKTRNAMHIFIGATAEYAAIVHESVHFNFRIGGAKFLQRAINENIGKIREILCDGMPG